MAPTNNFLPFCPTDTGSNLLTQSDYAAASDRTNGNQPGVASAKLVNKAIRQGTYITSQLAQFLANQSGADVLDDATPARLLAQFMATLAPYAPNVTKFLSGSGNFNLTYIFQIATGSATVGATYTNNAITYTVIATVASGLAIRMSGSGAPTASGTLTKASGTGDATLTFYAVRAPVYLRVFLAGGGGGSGGSANASANAVAGGTGGTSYFRVGASPDLLVAEGGVGGGVAGGGGQGGAGGAASLGTGPVGVAIPGGSGNGITGLTSFAVVGASGGNCALGGGGGGGSAAPGYAGTAGGGAGGAGSPAAGYTGAGGGGAGFVDAIISSPAPTYQYAVGAAGAAGTAGSSGANGAGGGAGLVVVEEHYS